MATYYALTVKAEFLKGLPALSDDATEHGLTQSDLTRAEDMAYREINGYLAQSYDVSGWSGEAIPAQVADIANMLASAYVLGMAQGANSIDPMDATGGTLYGRALQRLEAIRDGSEVLIAADGGVVPRVLRDGLIGCLPS